MDISISQDANEDAELSQTLQTICTLQEDWDACLKCTREYNSLQYDHVTTATSDLLGFRLNVVESADSAIGDMTADDTTADDTMTDDTMADDTMAEDTYKSVILTSSRTEKMIGPCSPPIISSPISSSSSIKCTTQSRRKLTPKTVCNLKVVTSPCYRLLMILKLFICSLRKVGLAKHYCEEAAL